MTVNPLLAAVLVGALSVPVGAMADPASAAESTSVTPPAPTSTAAPTPLAPPPGEFSVEVVTVNGSGCPVGTVAVAVARDNLAFVVAYSDYLAESGPGVPATAARRNCQITLAMHYPQSEYTYAVRQVRYAGYASLAEGATGSVRVSEYRSGQSVPAPFVLTLPGPFEDWWELTGLRLPGELLWTSCSWSSYLSVNTAVWISRGTSAAEATSYLGMSEISRTDLEWRWCSEPSTPTPVTSTPVTSAPSTPGPEPT